jgi:hypothetical protein
MPFTIHLNPGVIFPIQTSVHVFCVCYCFILCLHSFFFSFRQNLRGLELLKNRWHCPFNPFWVLSVFMLSFMKYVTAWKLFTPTPYNLHGWRSVLHLEVEPLFINAKKIKVECTVIQSQSTVFSSSQAMAQRKETPKMTYPKSALFSECKCRLCGRIIDKKYRNNLFLELAE